MAVKGVTDKIRVPRLGVIKIGEMVQVPGQPEGRTMPRSSEHFLLPDEVASVMGNQVTVIEPVMLPFSDRKLFAHDEYRMYSQTRGLICRGDGAWAERVVSKADADDNRLRGDGGLGDYANQFQPALRDATETGRVTRSCPCEWLQKPGGCGLKMAFQFLLPTVPGFGVWQLNTGSRNTILNIVSFIEMLNGTFGRAHLIPLRLLLEFVEVQTPDGKRRKVPVCRLDFPSGKTLMSMLEEYKELPNGSGSGAALVANDSETFELEDGVAETPFDIAPTPQQIADARAEQEFHEVLSDIYHEASVLGWDDFALNMAWAGVSGFDTEPFDIASGGLTTAERVSVGELKRLLNALRGEDENASARDSG
jgi:hypothetical protein